MPSLPPELLSHIFEFTDHISPYGDISTDRRLLRNASLVSRTWSTPAQRHLHDNVSLSGGLSEKLWLESSAPGRRDVRRLALVGPLILSNVLQDCRRLERLEIRAAGSGVVLHAKQLLSPAFASKCQASRGLEAPATERQANSDHFADLTSLNLDCEVDYTAASPLAFPFHLRTLQLNASHGFAHFFITSLFATSIETLHTLFVTGLRDTSPSRGSLKLVMSTVASSLRSLTLAMSDPELVLAMFPLCTSLTYLAQEQDFGLWGPADTDTMLAALPPSTLRRFGIAGSALRTWVPQLTETLDLPSMKRLEKLELPMNTLEQMRQFDGGPELVAECERRKIEIEFKSEVEDEFSVGSISLY